VVTTRTMKDPKSHQFDDQRNRIEDQKRQATERTLQRRPIINRLVPDVPLKLEKFLTDHDNLDSQAVIEGKMTDLFGAVPEKLLLFVHGYNTDSVGATNSGKMLSESSGMPVLVFDWASVHGMGLGGVAPGQCWPGVIAGYFRDTEEAVASVQALNWLLFIVLRAVKKVNIVCHSMGSQITVASLYSIAEGYRLVKRDFNRLQWQKYPEGGPQPSTKAKKADLKDFMKEYLEFMNSRSDSSAGPEPFFSQYQTMLAALNCVVFKQADCHIVTMKKFLATDVPTLSEEGEDVRVFIYSHNNDRVLGLSQSLHYGINRVGQMDGLNDIWKGVKPLPPTGTSNVHPIDASVCTANGFLTFLNLVANHSYFHYPEFQASIKRVMAATDVVDGPDLYDDCPESKPLGDGPIYKLPKMKDEDKQQWEAFKAGGRGLSAGSA